MIDESPCLILVPWKLGPGLPRCQCPGATLDRLDLVGRVLSAHGLSWAPHPNAVPATQWTAGRVCPAACPPWSVAVGLIRKPWWLGFLLSWRRRPYVARKEVRPVLPAHQQHWAVPVQHSTLNLHIKLGHEVSFQFYFIIKNNDDALCFLKEIKDSWFHHGKPLYCVFLKFPSLGNAFCAQLFCWFFFLFFSFLIYVVWSFLKK